MCSMTSPNWEPSVRTKLAAREPLHAATEALERSRIADLGGRLGPVDFALGGLTPELVDHHGGRLVGQDLVDPARTEATAAGVGGIDGQVRQAEGLAQHLKVVGLYVTCPDENLAVGASSAGFERVELDIGLVALLE